MKNTLLITCQKNRGELTCQYDKTMLIGDFTLFYFTTDNKDFEI